MTRDGSSRDCFFGRAGQLAVVVELLKFGVNAAIPEVDEGEDTLAFVSTGTQIDRLQVKTATATPLKTEGCYSARVSVPLAHLDANWAPLHYVFVICLLGRWSDFVFVPRQELRRQCREEGVGHKNIRAGEQQLTLSFSPTGLECSGQDWTAFRNAWQVLPVVKFRSTQKE